MHALFRLVLVMIGLAWAAPAAAQSGALQEYTLALPADLGSDQTLCQLQINHADLGFASATMIHDSTAPLKDGGAMASQRGVYDGQLAIVVELCGIDDGFALLAEITGILEEGIAGAKDAALVQRSFHTGKDASAFYRFDAVSYTSSTNLLVDKIRERFAQIAEVTFSVGNRALLIDGCARDGLWVTVAAGDKVVWTKHFTGFRVLALRKPAGNLFVTYAAGTDSLCLNIAAAKAAGAVPIGAAPSDDDNRDPETFTWGIAHFGGEPGMPNGVRSVSGSVRLTAVAQGTATGLFRFTGLDQNGVEH